MKPTYEQIKQARQTLKNAGYFVENLWHVDDVKNQYDDMFIDAESAYEILDDAVTNTHVMETIGDIIVENLNEIRGWK